MSKVASIHLWKPGSLHDAEAGDYCGSYWIYEDANPAVDSILAACGVGRFRDDEGKIGRAFFTADEIDARVAEAERVTECEVEVSWDNYSREAVSPVSDPTYRIDVEPYVDSVFAWKATVVRLSDDAVLKIVVNKEREEVLREAQACVVAAANGAGASFSVYVDDDGQPVEAHSVKA